MNNLNYFFWSWFVLLLMTLPVFGQTDSQNQADEDATVVRIGKNLVQLDVVVTDKKGRQITDLKPEEFLLTEENHNRKITNFSYISLDTKRISSTPANSSAPPVTTRRNNDIQRVFALVVDDLALSFEGVSYVRKALKKFIDEQMQPGDLVAIVRTSSGSGSLQQFTRDKRQLMAVIETIRFRFGRGTDEFKGDNTTFGQVQAAANPKGSNKSDSGNNLASAFNKEAFVEIEKLREKGLYAGTLGSLNFLIRGLKEFPGRKAILLFSENLSLFNEDNTEKINSISRLTDLANRSSTVIYTIDTRGLQPPDSPGKSDDGGRASQEGLRFLAEQTGGFFTQLNNISENIGKVVEDQNGYYLIGYDPDEEDFVSKNGRPRFLKVKVRVTRPGLLVRSRSGFYGITDEEVNLKSRRSERLSNALLSPFSSGDIDLRLTALFSQENSSLLMRSLIHMEAGNLTFNQSADGGLKSIIDVVAVVFREDGQAINQINRTYTISASNDFYQRILKEGLVYALDIPLEKPGAYQVRIAVRDAASERIGSANQFIEVPDVANGRLTLSSIVLNGALPEAAPVASATKDAGETRNELLLPVLRRFQHGMVLDYNYYIYNPRLDRSNRAQIKTQVRLFRNGEPIFTGDLKPFENAEPQNNRLSGGGRLKLAEDMEKGEYILQVNVVDELANKKYSLATQTVDFEIN